MKLLTALALLVSTSVYAVSASTDEVENKVKIQTEAEENKESIAAEVDKLAKEAQGLPAKAEETAKDTDPDLEIEEL